MASEKLDEKAIFNIARQIDAPEARREYLRQVCGDDAELMERVEDLLRGYESQASFLESPPIEIVSPTIDPPTAEKPGAQIGPYKLLQQIGEGGMGVVYLAEQAEPVNRRVALKLIKPGMDSRQIVARFEAERQALAMMDHVNIARVLDAGATESARPYFVMELVHGVPITKYCDDNQLTPRQRLELFVPVCQAIQHAHQKGIIHRDIKPSNVMITLYDGKPVAKVIDFGVAKATEQKLAERTLFTQYGTMVGTLEYMSPEQAEMSALGVDTRSDIYSLGVMLYELLTGSTPLIHKRLKEAAYAEILRMIKEEEPPRPSVRLSESGDTLASISAQRHTEPAKLTRLVRGELDWIVMKTLEKDRNRRYETANGFAADVQRFLNDETVQACPPSAQYRFRKFARRNNRTLAAVAVVLCLFVVLGSSIWWSVLDRSARDAEAHRHLAERQAKVAGQVDSILAEVERLQVEQKWPEALALARRAEAALVVGEAQVATAQRVHTFLNDLLFIEKLEQIRMTKATIVEGNLDYAGADRKYSQAFRDYGLDLETVAVETAINGLNARPAFAISIAATLDDWIDARRTVSPSDVLVSNRLALVARGIDPEPLRNEIRMILGQPVSDVQDEILRLANSIDIRRHQPATIISLSRVLKLSGQSDSAVQLLRDAQHIHPGDFWLNYELSAALTARQEHVEAVRYSTACVSIRPNSSTAHNNLGAVLFNQHRRVHQGMAINQKGLDEAVESDRRAIELDPTNPKPHFNLGLALFEQGKVEESITAYRNAIDMDPKFANAYACLGVALWSKGDAENAIRNYRIAIKINPKCANAFHGLGIVCLEQNQVDDAEAHFRTVIQLDPNHAAGHSMLGKTLASKCNWVESIASHRRAIALDPLNPVVHYGLGFAMKSQGMVDGAISAYGRATELDPKWTMAYLGLGNALRRKGKGEDALVAYRKAIEIDPKMSAGHQGVGNVLSSNGDWDGALAAYRRAIELDPQFGYAYYGLGNALSAKDELDAAVAAYRTAIKLDSEPNAHLGLARVAWTLANHGDLKVRDPNRSVELANEAVEVAPQDTMGWQYLGWIQYRAGNSQASIDALEKSCKLQSEGTGDAFQWIVLALAHARLAEQKEMPAEQRERHLGEARRWYEKADNVLASRWQVRPVDPWQQSVWDFHAEAKELMAALDNED